MCESRKQGKAARPMLERDILELSWTGDGTQTHNHQVSRPVLYQLEGARRTYLIGRC